MRPLRALSLLLVFCIDVHVKAESLGTCKLAPCAVRAQTGIRLLEDKGKWRMTMARESIAERRSSSLVELVDGEFYVESSSSTQFSTPYGHIQCLDECKALIERTPSRVSVKSLEGRWIVKRTGEAQNYALAAGLQLRLGEVTTDGQAEMEFPQSLPWNSTVEAWASLYPGPMKELKPTLVKFRLVWREAVEAASVLHQKIVTRTIASHDEKLAEERAAQQRHEREDQRLRALFREKTP